MSNKTKKNRNKYNLEILFDNILEKSYKERKKNPTNFDGLGFLATNKKNFRTIRYLQCNKMEKNIKNKN